MKRPDVPETFDDWFRKEVDAGLRAANSPHAIWLTHEEAKEDAAALRAELILRIADGKI